MSEPETTADTVEKLRELIVYYNRLVPKLEWAVRDAQIKVAKAHADLELARGLQLT